MSLSDHGSAPGNGAASNNGWFPCHGEPGWVPEDPLAAILDILRQGERFLVCSHSRPDGDAVGSMLAMGVLIQKLGKRVDLVAADRVPNIYRGVPGADAIHFAMRVHGPYDAVIVLECDSTERTGLRGLEEFQLVNIDHHSTGRNYAHVNWIDRDAASVGELVHRLIKASGVAVTPEMATCLYITVLTDTGGFCYGNTSASTFALAGELVQAGADPIRIAQEVYFSTATSKLLLLGAALSNLKREGRLAWLSVSHQDMVRTCAAEEDCEGIVNYAVSIAGVEAAIFLRELPEGRIRASLRSKGGVDVASIAQGLGGGGHENAAGVTLDGPLPRALDEILAALRPCVAQHLPKHEELPWDPRG
ncbi:DHH family phosphoesterase [Occallatibacter riparius]|uniref:Bifunctional oligoribonuclease/PAP phosphatase NrnA n=1 Tax=Occallatibacter riparius TaxID=1002689 RepID=A0A9J7BV18_9BACT|nr:bifunctional oligoribonuclease/PAP phosphatase NrnA [Occallatibacter riparius]UWZ84758.1 bifunctional oligoribonuclease/PAP phosphatase NrnA [Occallatibacter riparius]